MKSILKTTRRIKRERALAVFDAPVPSPQTFIAKAGSMTPYQLAKAECSNMLRDGSCLGVYPVCFSETELVPMKAQERCLVVDGKRCRFFEKAVLPVADWPSPKDHPKLQQRRLKARDAYWWRHDFCKRKAAGNRVCPECGGSLAKRQRLCSECSQKRRRTAKRESMRRARLPVDS